MERYPSQPEEIGSFEAKVHLSELLRETEHGRSYLIKTGTQIVPGTITAIKFRTNVNTLEHSAANKLMLNEVGTVTIATDKPVAFDAYGRNATTGERPFATESTTTTDGVTTGTGRPVAASTRDATSSNAWRILMPAPLPTT